MVLTSPSHLFVRRTRCRSCYLSYTVRCGMCDVRSKLEYDTRLSKSYLTLCDLCWYTTHDSVRIIYLTLCNLCWYTTHDSVRTIHLTLCDLCWYTTHDSVRTIYFSLCNLCWYTTHGSVRIIHITLCNLCWYTTHDSGRRGQPVLITCQHATSRALGLGASLQFSHPLQYCFWNTLPAEKTLETLKTHEKSGSHWAWEHPCSIATLYNKLFGIHSLLKKTMKPWKRMKNLGCIVPGSIPAV